MLLLRHISVDRGAITFVSGELILSISNHVILLKTVSVHCKIVFKCTKPRAKTHADNTRLTFVYAHQLDTSATL